MEIAVDKLNFTVGPVQMSDSIRKIGGQQIPYFRTREFSRLMFENEKLLKELLCADERTRMISLTGSGTAGMEATVMNVLDRSDKALVVNGGGFGERFAILCRQHRIPYEEIKLSVGKGLTMSDLEPYEKRGFTAFLVNYHETSTGVLYNMDLISGFCKRNQCILIVDAISSFLADSFLMKEWGVNAVITGSQKAYAIPPGLSLIALDYVAQERVKKKKCSVLYFDLESYLLNGERGQTPFTPAVGILIQLNKRLREIADIGLVNVQRRTAELAMHFRKNIAGLPLVVASDSLSNAVTPLLVREEKDAYEVFEILEEDYGIWVCPSGGEMKHRMFRVGHLGNLTQKDNNMLVSALWELYKRNKL